jgi:hypothetical protein
LEGDSGNPDHSSRVQAVVNVFGPTDIKACYETSSVAWIFRLFMGGTPHKFAETYRTASPITWVSQDDPPVLTLHGSEDKAVPFAQAVTLDEKLKSAGGRHTLIEFEGQGHGFGGAHRQQELHEMWKFLTSSCDRPRLVFRHADVRVANGMAILLPVDSPAILYATVHENELQQLPTTSIRSCHHTLSGVRARTLDRASATKQLFGCSMGAVRAKQDIS